MWTVPADTLDRWRLGIDRLDSATREEREFWDEYMLRLRRTLALIAAPNRK
jgi:hypothetical protein